MKEILSHNDDWCYTNLYRVSDDFIPKNPGKDYMWLLPHHHIDNFVLEQVKAHGLNALWNP